MVNLDRCVTQEEREQFNMKIVKEWSCISEEKRKMLLNSMARLLANSYADSKTKAQ